MLLTILGQWANAVVSGETVNLGMSIDTTRMLIYSLTAVLFTIVDRRLGMKSGATELIIESDGNS